MLTDSCRQSRTEAHELCLVLQLLAASSLAKPFSCLRSPGKRHGGLPLLVGRPHFASPCEPQSQAWNAPLQNMHPLRCVLLGSLSAALVKPGPAMQGRTLKVTESKAFNYKGETQCSEREALQRP